MNWGHDSLREEQNEGNGEKQGMNELEYEKMCEREREKYINGRPKERKAKRQNARHLRRMSAPSKTNTIRKTIIGKSML